MSFRRASVVNGCNHISPVCKKCHLSHHEIFVAASVAAARYPYDTGLRGLVLFVYDTCRKSHLTVSVLKHYRHFQFHGISVQILYFTINYTIQEIDTLSFLSRFYNISHYFRYPFLQLSNSFFLTHNHYIDDDKSNSAV